MIFRFVIHKEHHWEFIKTGIAGTTNTASKTHLRLLSTSSLVWTKSLALAFINFSVTFANKGLFPVSKRDVETLFGFFPAKLNVHAVELL